MPSVPLLFLPRHDTSPSLIFSLALADRIGSESCTGTGEKYSEAPVGILGYLDLPGEALDLPYQLWVFAEEGKPITSTLKISFDKMEWVDKFRDFKAKLGIDRDDQWSSEISLWGTRPFSCTWPNDIHGCVAAETPRGFLKLKIGRIKFNKMLDAVLSERRKQRKNRLFNFELHDTTLTLARSPPDVYDEDDFDGWGSYAKLEDSEDFEYFKLFKDEDDEDHDEDLTSNPDGVPNEKADQLMIPEEIQYAAMDGIYFSTHFKFDNPIAKKIMCLTPMIMGLECPDVPMAMHAFVARASDDPLKAGESSEKSWFGTLAREKKKTSQPRPCMPRGSARVPLMIDLC